MRWVPRPIGLYARVKANALKVATLLALLRAVGSAELVVTVEDLEKGRRWRSKSATTTVDGAMKHMAGSELRNTAKFFCGDARGYRCAARNWRCQSLYRVLRASKGARRVI
jgi:hypothetical protein